MRAENGAQPKLPDCLASCQSLTKYFLPIFLKIFLFTSCIYFQEPLIFAGRGLEIQFRMSRALTDFMATLHKNGIEEKKLSKYVTHNVIDDTVSFNIRQVYF